MSNPPPTAHLPARPVDRGRASFEVAALVVILALGTVSRVACTRSEPVRGDEAFTYNEYARSSAYDAVSLYTFPNNHLFHSLLVHVAVKAFGSAPWSLRLPALLAGVALIPAVYALARRFAGPAAGLFAAALVASSDPLISYSANARGYSLLGLITVLTVSAARRVADEGKPRDYLALTLLPPLGFWTVPVMLYPYAGVVLWLLASKLAGRARGLRLDRLFVSGLVCSGLTLTLYAPALIRSGPEAIVGNRFVRPLPWDEVTRNLPRSLVEVWRQWNLDIPWPVGLAFVAVWVAALMVPSAGRAGVRRLTTVVAAVVAASLAVVLYQRVVPFDRVWLFLLPLYLACVGSALAWGGRWLPAWSLSLGAGVLCEVFTGLVVGGGAISRESDQLTITNGPEVVRAIAADLRPDDAVVCELPSDAPLKYYVLTGGLPVEVLYDYRIARARRLFVVVNRPNGQTPESVLRFNKIAPPPGAPLRPVADFGTSAVFALERW